MESMWPIDDQWAVAMFSFTTEIVRGELTPQDLLLGARAARLAELFEIDGFQHFATFPDVSEDEADLFRADVDRLGIRLTALGIYDDFYIDPRRRAGVAGRISYLEQQIESAGRLGFPAVKIMWGVDLEVLDGLRPCLDRVGISLHQEAQGALCVDAPDVERRVEFAGRHPDLFGFVFDLSACMYGAPVTYLEELRRLGVPGEVVRLIAEEWPADRDGAVRDRVLALTDRVGLSPTARLRLMMPFGRFGNSRVSEFRDFLRLASVIHLKFWDLCDDDSIVSAPIGELCRELGRIGFAGPLTSEWGGHEWLDGPGFDAITMTCGHRSLVEAAVAR
jgi:sugar phosphate isomerase/epimerase